MSSTKVAVIGGGVIGLSSAVHLARAGCAVDLLEQDQLTSGSSSLSVGVYTRQYTDAFEIQMRMFAVAELERLERERGLHMRRIGYLRLAHDQGTFEQLAQGLEVQRSLGLDDGELLSRADLESRLPAMRVDDLAGGVLGRTDGYLDGHQLCMTFAEMAEELGVRICTKTKVAAASRVDGRHLLSTSKGEFEADVVVNAAGAWAGAVGEILGSPVEIIAQRHQACVIGIANPPDYVVPEVMDYVPGSGTEGLYFRHERADALVAGLHTNDVLPGQEEDVDAYFRGVESEYEEALAARLVDRLPGLEMSIQTGWAGLYPMSADSQVIVGPDPDDASIVNACAMGGLGIHLSPAVGRMVSEYVNEGGVSFLEGASRLLPDRESLRPRSAKASTLGVEEHLDRAHPQAG